MSADDIVQEILAETKRRKKVWAQMQRKAKEALAAVQKVAKQRGIKGNDWVTGTSEAAMIQYTLERGKYKYIDLDRTGKITDDMAKIAEKVHGGYPDLPDDTPDIFLKAAVEQLMENLNDYCEQQQS